MIPKNYSYDPVLRRYLDDKLKIEKLKKTASEPGKRLSKIDRRQIEANDKKKVKVLDNHVFRSIANLIYFFEFLNNHPELAEIFDSDVENLLGFRGAIYKRQDVTLLRFIDSILNFGNRNLRLQLVKEIGETIIQILLSLGMEKDYRLGTRVIPQDLSRAQEWGEYCTSERKLNTKPAHRKIAF